ncbi:unnamed protein product [Zymoseptoria tritici ST99CH_1A5]|uniref:Uncharacterized protein n=1 Tax=Zymoseptoria tritici ST99CH_1A5 TaxID=1276529 RepID=A0A1Y6LUK3_ZYMTR|nr:unnamed protein product [Zymoseptoria tritici ST99CH_1A5]
MANKLKQPSLTKPSLTPPHLARQHSYSTRQDNIHHSDATSVLSNISSRRSTPPRSPDERPQSDRRESWEDCKLKREGYVSFPDFDRLRAMGEGKKV